jgi:hypothetical protein
MQVSRDVVAVPFCRRNSIAWKPWPSLRQAWLTLMFLTLPHNVVLDVPLPGREGGLFTLDKRYEAEARVIFEMLKHTHTQDSPLNLVDMHPYVCNTLPHVHRASFGHCPLYSLTTFLRPCMGHWLVITWIGCTQVNSYFEYAPAILAIYTSGQLRFYQINQGRCKVVKIFTSNLSSGRSLVAARSAPAWRVTPQ